MKIQGEEEAIAALKAMHEEDKEGVKFLIKDAQTTTDNAAYFRGKDGRKFRLRLEPDGVIFVEAVDESAPKSQAPRSQASSRPPPPKPGETG